MRGGGACARGPDPRWASWNLGIFICVRCAGIHRSLGATVSKVRSVNLDAWTHEQLQVLAHRYPGAQPVARGALLHTLNARRQRACSVRAGPSQSIDDMGNTRANAIYLALLPADHPPLATEDPAYVRVADGLRATCVKRRARLAGVRVWACRAVLAWIRAKYVRGEWRKDRQTMPDQVCARGL